MEADQLPHNGRGGINRSGRNRNAEQRINQAPRLLPPGSQTTPCCSTSIASQGSTINEGARRKTLRIDDIVKRVYVYFHTLLLSVRRQKKIAEQQTSGQANNNDGRWGATSKKRKDGSRVSAQDPWGCLAPIGLGDPTRPLAYIGYWAVPHPTVYFTMLAITIEDYLVFLKKTYPSAVSADFTGTLPSEHRPHERYNAEEYLLPTMMSILQSMTARPMHSPLIPSSCLFSPPSTPSAIHSPRTNSDGTTSPNFAFARNFSDYDPNHQRNEQSKSEMRKNGKKRLKIRERHWPCVLRDYRQVVHFRFSADFRKFSLVNARRLRILIRRFEFCRARFMPVPFLYRANMTYCLPIVPISPKMRWPYYLEAFPISQTDHISPQNKPFEDVRNIKCAQPTSNGVQHNGQNGTVNQNQNQHQQNSPQISHLAAGPFFPTQHCFNRPPIISFGSFEISKMDVLSEEIWHYHKSVEQTEATLIRKLQLRDLLYYAISTIFPVCGLYVVGSSLNGFGTNSSDMDLCLMITNKDLDQKTDAIVVLNMVLATLTGVEFVASQQLIAAKVPILRIKFTAPFEDITVDLNANNTVTIKNTRLLCYYSSYDWRVRPLVTVVKEWARRKGINDANRSSFTSYSLVLMVIHYLQCGCRPPVLPSLQRCYPEWFKPQCDVRTLNVTKTLPAPDKYVFRFENHMSLGELLVGFLDYYANRFDYNKDAISVRWGKRLDRVAVVAKKSPYSVSRSPNDTPISLNGNDISQQWIAQWRCICIEEPFTRQNTAHSVYDEMIFEEIKRAFREAHTELEATRDLKTFLENATPISTTYSPYIMS
ncbi:hypothetical protein WR25_04249 [Diploscapter pachys]|uniref:polynucleotide adenylyltransferase n=1 Tax=Diploscapter pachys TaxID=2018661 RepID=A0A2A2K1J5_9BILA|nr:hypothetical protein WR25_04249 [Diploscapter pachys]